MIRMMLLAVLTGILVSVPAISFIKGFDAAGMVVGLLSIVLLFGTALSMGLLNKRAAKHI